MKRTTVVLLGFAIFGLAHPRTTTAQVFYQYPAATITRAGEFVVGPHLSVGDNELYRLGGFGRMNATRYFDVGFEFLFDSANGDGRFGAGGDLKFSLFPDTKAIPFDLSVTAGVGVIKSDKIEVLQVPFGGIISSDFQLDSGNIIAPYLGIYLLLVDTEIDRGPRPAITDTDLDVEMRGGVRYTLTDGPDLFVAIHLGRDALVTVGASFWLKRRR